MCRTGMGSLLSSTFRRCSRHASACSSRRRARSLVRVQQLAVAGGWARMLPLPTLGLPTPHPSRLPAPPAWLLLPLACSPACLRLPPSPLANAVSCTSSRALLHGAGGDNGGEAGGGGLGGVVQP